MIARNRLKPPQPYPYIIAECILAAPKQRLTLRDLYAAIEKRYSEYYGRGGIHDQAAAALAAAKRHPGQPAVPVSSRSGPTRPWQNTVRFNLSRSGIFTKVELLRQNQAQGPGRRCSYWGIVDEWLQRIKRDGLSILLAMGDARKSRRVAAAVAAAAAEASSFPEDNDKQWSVGLSEEVEAEEEVEDEEDEINHDGCSSFEEEGRFVRENSVTSTKPSPSERTVSPSSASSKSEGIKSSTGGPSRRVAISSLLN
jgi:hypothetical protein